MSSARNMSRKIGAGGAWLLAVALGFIPTVWPNAIRPHPYWVAGLIVLGIVMLAYPWMQKKLYPPSEPASIPAVFFAEANTETTVSPNLQDVGSPSVKAETSSSVSNAPVITNAPVFNLVQPTPLLPHASESLRLDTKANLISLGTNFPKVDEDSPFWSDDLGVLVT